MSTTDARAVAADLLRQAGDEQGARVLERANELPMIANDAVYAARRGSPMWQHAWDVYAYLDPAWAAAEVERAHGEALEIEVGRRECESCGYSPCLCNQQ